MKKLRVGVIGLGIGGGHAREFQKHPGAEVTALAGWICDVLDDVDNPAVIDAVRAKVTELCQRFPVYGR